MNPNRSVRPKSKRRRVSLVNRDVLTVDGYDPEASPYVLRVVNDDPANPGRIERFKEAGWEAVKSTEEKLGDEAVDNVRAPGSFVSRPVGGGVLGVLMRKSKVEFEEDMRPVHEQADNVERAIFGQLDADDTRYGRIAAFGRTREKKG